MLGLAMVGGRLSVERVYGVDDDLTLLNNA